MLLDLDINDGDILERLDSNAWYPAGSTADPETESVDDLLLSNSCVRRPVPLTE